MTWLNTVWSEFIGLFVDDGSFAIAILAWLAACWLLLPRLGLAPCSGVCDIPRKCQMNIPQFLATA